ncbi:hypothetical protein [Streptomyces sp. NPDC047028]
MWLLTALVFASAVALIAWAVLFVEDEAHSASESVWLPSQRSGGDQ